MIKIHGYKSDSNFPNKYREEMGAKVYKKALKYKEFWEEKFKSSFLHGKLQKSFFEDIVSRPLQELKDTYQDVKDYFDFAFFASVDLMDIGNKEEYGKKYYEKIKENPFLASLQSDKNITKTGNDFDIDSIQDKAKEHLDEINETIQKCIDYKNMLSKQDKSDIIDGLNIKVCPYCNRQYVSAFEIENEDTRRFGDIDHFYPKKFFALFGLSLYNFVPACKVCNSLFKCDINAAIRNPYEMDTECNLDFSVTRRDGELYPETDLGWNDDFSLEVRSASEELEDKMCDEREIHLFQLNAQYSIHKGYVKNLLQKKYIFQKSYREWLLDFLRNENCDLTDGELQDILYGMDFDEADYTQTPLSKLTKDIIDKY